MALKELLERATPLPWRRRYSTSYTPAHGVYGPPHADGGDYAAIMRASEEADAILATHAVNVLPDTLRALERMRDIQVNENSEPDAMAEGLKTIERIVLGALVKINNIEGK